MLAILRIARLTCIQKVSNLAELIRFVEAGADNPFVVFNDDRDGLIVLDR